ncbi:hypothetical protein LCGC14_1575630 [marine sediment metagenome]|uniref:Uncharacterized protein n=1 Tax=marine sediment metagenome TaxID=412755 RepID=A0A0F9LIP5_9ZZZZ
MKNAFWSLVVGLILIVALLTATGVVIYYFPEILCG